MTRYKYILAPQIDGSDLFLIYRGEQVFTVAPVASCSVEEEAQLIVDALNAHDQLAAVLRRVL